MSKSRGNIVRATPIVDVMGVDALRYFLLREVVFGKDGIFSYDALVGRYNSDLANGLGNLVSRTLSMINQYRDGFIPAKAEVSLTDTIRRVQQFYDELDFSRALEEIWSAISWLDGYIVQQQPWKLAKCQAEGAQDQLDAVLYTAAEYIRVITALVAPVLPETAIKIWRMLGMQKPVEDVRFDDLAEQALPPGRKWSRSPRSSLASKRSRRSRKCRSSRWKRRAVRRRSSARKTFGGAGRLSRRSQLRRRRQRRSART